MPIYLSKKVDLSVPTESESALDNYAAESYLNDPDLLIDELPQPFRFVNKLIHQVLTESWDIIAAREQEKLLRREIQQKTSGKSGEYLAMDGRIQFLCGSSVDSRFLLVGLTGAIKVYDTDKMSILDSFEGEDGNMERMASVKLTETSEILYGLDNEGNAKLYAMSHGRLYFVRKFPSGKENVQVTNIELDPDCTFLSVVLNPFLETAPKEDQDAWIEVYKIPKSNWMKELDSVGRAYKEYLVSQTANSLNDASTIGTDLSPDQTAFLDRNGAKLSPVTLAMKAKFPNVLAAPGLPNGLSQMMKVIHGSEQILGLGMNHFFSNDFFEQQNQIFHQSNRILYENIDQIKKQDVNNTDVNREDVKVTYKEAKIQYCFSNLKLCSTTHSTASQEHAYVITNWSNSHHLLMYNLNNKAVKGSAENWARYDHVRSHAHSVSLMHVFQDSFLAVGLENGQFIITDLSSGLTKFNELISTRALKELQTFSRPVDNKLLLIVTDDVFQIITIAMDTKLNSFQVTNTIKPQESRADLVKMLGNGTQNVFMVDNFSQMVLYDAVQGERDFFLETPDDWILYQPYEPVLAKSDHFVALAGIQVSSESDEDSDKRKDEENYSVVLFKTKDSFSCSQPEIGEDISVKLPQKEEELSFVYKLMDQFLQERYTSHEERQADIMDCWSSLEDRFQNSAPPDVSVN